MRKTTGIFQLENSIPSRPTAEDDCNESQSLHCRLANEIILHHAETIFMSPLEVCFTFKTYMLLYIVLHVMKVAVQLPVGASLDEYQVDHQVPLDSK